ncbi:MAG: DUF1573 domain-containing protein [Candidatus Cryptobacteroides sp.]
MKKIQYIIGVLMTLAGMMAAGQLAGAQEKFGDWEFDSTVHDFGNVMLSDGPLSYSFTVKNTGPAAAVIYQVGSSCGCTDVRWTKEPIRPGATGSISFTYSNDEGPYPFEKTLTVYLSGHKKPVILKFRGVAHEKQKSLEEMFPVRYGSLALRSADIKCGNMEQKGSRSDVIKVGNLSDKPVKVTFTDVTPELSLKVKPNPVPARGTAEISYTVKASREKWGKNYYYATPLINGTSFKATGEGLPSWAATDGKIGIWAFTKEFFGELSDEQKSKAARPMMEESTFSFMKIKKGETVHAEFTMENQGREPLKVYKLDADAPAYSHSFIPVAKPGEKIRFRVHVDTSYLPAGETLVVVTLTTNSPLRPIVNIFITGLIEE